MYLGVCMYVCLAVLLYDCTDRKVSILCVRVCVCVRSKAARLMAGLLYDYTNGSVML